MFTVICCYNNEKMYREFVLKSLDTQRSQYMLIGIDNTNGQYTSTAQAYNHALRDVQTKYCLFLHQDIAFDNPNFLEQLEHSISQKQRTIFGFCGIKNNAVVYSNLKYKCDGSYIVKNQLLEAIEVESVDECCFAIETAYLREIRGFNEEICDGWHLYAVELSIRIKQNGGKCLVSPISIYHKWNNSSGQMTDIDFLKCLRRICITYAGLGTIYAPCYICSTNGIARDLKLLRTLIKNIASKRS